MIMLDDAVRAHQKEDEVRVMDISQVMEESLGPPTKVGASAPAPPTSADGPVGAELAVDTAVSADGD